MKNLYALYHKTSEYNGISQMAKAHLHRKLALRVKVVNRPAFRVWFGLNFDENFGLISGLIRYLQINFQKTKLFCDLTFTLCKLS